MRPATILGDVAVAVHPDDDRYKQLVGREVIVPFVERRVPVIADERVEMSFGTGALKITPAHDPTDYEIGRDHELPELTVIGPDGLMNEEAGELAGLTQAEADERILAWLREHDQLEKRESYRHTVSLCDRCKTRIEPRISLQWWCSMEELKKPALDALRSGARHVPSRVAAPLRDLFARGCARLEHLAPDLVGPPAAALGVPGRPRHRAGDDAGRVRRMRLDRADALDRTCSTRGSRRRSGRSRRSAGRSETEDLRTFYPGDMNTTARDIIRLWENRMIFAGLELMGEVPFKDVVIHSTVHAPTGGRMSKSLGTGMNPLAQIDAHGADATRYGLMKMASSQDVRFSEGAIEEGRKLANKLWNVARLILQAGEGAAPEERPQALEERWMLARLSQSQRAAEGYLAEFDFSHLVDELYHLTFDDFCDWYAEAIKQRLYDGDADARATATAALERLLKLLHPVMPHVTEEIWSYLPDRASRLIVAPWPEAGDDTEAGALAARAGVRRRCSAARACCRSSTARRSASSTRSSARSARRSRRTATSTPSARGCARRSSAPRSSSRTSGSSRTLRPTSSRPSAQKLERYRRELDAIGD